MLLTETITVLNFSGEAISTLPTSRTKPYRFSRDPESGYLAILNHDWRIRLVDTNQWIVFAEKEGKFKDVSIHRNHLIALDLNDHLHAACIKDHALDWVGQAETGLVVNQIAIGDHDQLFLLGSGPTAVHKIEYSIVCSE